MSRWFASFVLCFVLAGTAGCGGPTGYVVAFYDDAGVMIRCFMLTLGDPTPVVKGWRKSAAVRDGDWSAAFEELGITREGCLALSIEPEPEF
jgi:hypothetical protein